MYHSVILARDRATGGIGYNGKLPWTLKEDMAEFRKITANSTVIMGRKTYDGIGPGGLKGRKNIVVSSTLSPQEGIEIVPNLAKALEVPSKEYKFVIGGVNLYKDSFTHPYLETIYLTEVEYKGEVKYDTYFDDPIPLLFHLIETRTVTTDKYTLIFSKYNRSRYTSEQEYLTLMNRVLTEGEKRDDRTGTGTISLFGLHMEFDLTKGFPFDYNQVHSTSTCL